MFTLTGGKARTGRALGNPGGLDDRFGDLPLALRLLAGLLANAAFGTWWADPLAGLVIVDYALVSRVGCHFQVEFCDDGVCRELSRWS